MALFQKLDNAVAVLTSRGVHREVPLFERAGFVYAKWQGGFIQLREHACGTSVPNVQWAYVEGITYEFENFAMKRVHTSW